MWWSLGKLIDTRLLPLVPIYHYYIAVIQTVFSDGKLTSFDLIDNWVMKETQPTRFSIENVGTFGTHWIHCWPLFSQTYFVFPASNIHWSLPRLLLTPFSSKPSGLSNPKQFTWPHRRQTTSSSNDTARSGSSRFSFLWVSKR